MKTIIRFWLAACVALMIQTPLTYAQKYDEERMKRDIEVAENVLSTLIKQEISQQRQGWFGLDVKGTYLPGYGITFRLPSEVHMPYLAPVAVGAGGADTYIYDTRGDGYSYTIRSRDNNDDEGDTEESEAEKKAITLKEQAKAKRKAAVDSARAAYREKVIKASKDFILDYGDFISQLGATEKIVVTNQGEHRGFYYNTQKRTHISIEGTKADITAFRQGKMSRDQAIKNLKVVNTETVDVRQPDMELMSSIIGRLYRQDLSKTYFTEDNIYYELLKDYGAIFYMNVYSSNEVDATRVRMPTQGDEIMEKSARDKKVTELYPKFEQELKENIVEYGRTIKSLKPEENLVFNITLTKCKGCNIPSTLELSVKNSVLQDYAAGRIDKSGAVSKISVKKGANQ